MVSLQAVLKKHGLSPDIVLCAGDLTDKADPTALMFAWKELDELAGALNARLVATVGNHDIDSRHGNEIDPRGVLYDLEPPFPARDSATRDSFWARNYAIVDGPCTQSGAPVWRIVTLNSCAFHGYVADSGPELDHGRVSARTTERLRIDLESRPPAGINILLLHHHLDQLPNFDLTERSQLQEAQPLITLLERSASWLVVHGHKHRAHLMYAAGSANSPIVFSAGSLAAYPYGQAGATDAAKNQAHYVELLDPDQHCNNEMELAGTFRTWNWSPTGWVLASTQSGLPGLGGFGGRFSPIRLARRLARMLNIDNPTLNLSQLIDLEPRLRYALPSDIAIMTAELEKAQPPASCHLTEHGEITQVSMTIQPDQIAEFEAQVTARMDSIESEGAEESDGNV